MSETPSTRNGIHHQQHRPAKRSMNPENRQGTETAGLLSFSGSEDGTSETLLKTPYETEECVRKRPRVLSVRPCVSDSDINSDGEALKNYVLIINTYFYYILIIMEMLRLKDLQRPT